jgi:ribonuclease P protein subunit RPR2
MGKSKAEKKSQGIPNRHLHSRISYLHQAANYLSQTETSPSASSTQPDQNEGTLEGRHHQVASIRSHGAGQSRFLLTHLRGIAHKSQTRISKDMKHTVCKRCQALLIAGRSSEEVVTNASRGELKPWADVFEIRCNACAAVKRFPVGQKRKADDSTAKATTETRDEAVRGDK